MKYFTTLSQAHYVDKETTIQLLNQKCTKYLLTEETGATNSHFHIHIYMETDKWSSTDAVTRRFQKLYLKKYIDSLDSKRKLVLTKKVTTLSGTLQYMLKEQKSTENVKFLGFDKNYLEIQFKKLGFKHLQKTRVKLSLTEAPYLLYKMYPDMLAYDPIHIRKNLGKLVMHGYIVHHLYDDRQLGKIMLGLQDLKTYLSK